MAQTKVFVVVEGTHDLYFFLNYLKKVFCLNLKKEKKENYLENDWFTVKFLKTEGKEILLLKNENDGLSEIYKKMLNDNDKLLIIFDPDFDTKEFFEKQQTELTEKLKEKSPDHVGKITFANWNFDCPKFHTEAIALENITIDLLRKTENYPAKEIKNFLVAVKEKEILQKKIKIENKNEPNICKVLLSDKNLQTFYQEIIEKTEKDFLKNLVVQTYGVGKIFDFFNTQTQEK